MNMRNAIDARLPVLRRNGRLLPQARRVDVLQRRDELREVKAVLAQMQGVLQALVLAQGGMPVAAPVPSMPPAVRASQAPAPARPKKRSIVRRAAARLLMLASAD